MTNFNSFNASTNSWTIFAMFSHTKVLKNKFDNIIAATFFSGKYQLQLDDGIIYNLALNNIQYIFIVKRDSKQATKEEFSFQNHTINVVSTSLSVLLDNQATVFKQEYTWDVVGKSLFIFYDYTWREIISHFALNNIMVSGGSSTKRHIISPVQFSLVYSISALGFRYPEIYNSFSNIHKDICMPKDSMTSSIKESETLNSILNISGGDIRNGSFFAGGKTNLRDDNDSKKKFSTFCSSYNKKDNVSESFSFYLDILKDIIDNSENDPLRAQLMLENSWLTILRDKLLNSNLGVQSKLPTIFKKSKETLEIASLNGDLKRRFKSLAVHLTDDKYLLMTLGYVLSQYSFNKRNNIAMNIGYNIIYEIFKKGGHGVDNFLAFKISIGYYNAIDGRADLNKIGRLGIYFINIFMNDPTHIFDEKFENLNSGDSDVSLIINPDYMELIQNELLLHPKAIPMICKPNLWGENLYGGFLENSELKEGLISGSTYHNHKVKNMGNLYDVTNYFNSIKFSINTELLSYLNGEGKALVKLLDEKFLTESNEEITSSEKMQRNITLKLAEVYKNIPFYLNVHSDWRGRIYTHSFFISYQGGDLNSAILQFFEGQPITESGLDYLYIYGANCYGNGWDKKTFEEKILWVKSSKDEIINMDASYISKADSPYLFAAFALTLRKLDANPKSVINIPVFLDATCSGIQHLAALLNDFNLASKVNLVPSDNVNDLYSSLLDPINKNINQYGKENIEFNSLSQIKLNRKIIKHPIMTKVYNVSILGIKDQLVSKFKKVKIDEKTIRYEAPGMNGIVLLNNKEIFKIATIINDTIFEKFPALKTIYDYFLDIVKVMVILEIPITWFTPSGLEITQSYCKSKVHKVSISFRGKSKKMVLREWEDKIDKQKQVNALIPNVIHSLDAAHLINLTKGAIKNNFTPIVSVHDCFGTHPNLMNELSHEVKKEFILLYTSPNYLQSFHNKIIQSIKDNNFDVITVGEETKVYHNKKTLTLPQCPKIGDLELKNIINSKYMIC